MLASRLGAGMPLGKATTPGLAVEERESVTSLWAPTHPPHPGAEQARWAAWSKAEAESHPSRLRTHSTSDTDAAPTVYHRVLSSLGAVC